jgi:hypothetical protein
MNKDQLNTLIHSLVKIIGTALVTHGATKAATTLNSEDVIGAIVTVVGVVLAHTAAGKTASAEPCCKTVAKVLPLVAILSLCGCSNVYKGPQNQTLITERFFGIKVTSTSGSGTPEIVLGAGSSTFAVNPVSTNQLYAAPSFSTVQFSQSMNPFNTSGSESAGWGDVSVNLNTNSTAQSITVVPKLNRPK